MPRHVVFLGRDASLVIALRALLDKNDQVSELDLVEDWWALADTPIDVVIVNLPPARRRLGIEEVRADHRGRMIVLLDPYEDPAVVPTSYGCSILKRPFGIGALFSMVVSPAPRSEAERADPRALATGERPEPAAPST